MRPLKIALLSQWYWQESRFHNDDEGGPTRQLAEAVAALGHEVVVLTQNPTVRKLRKFQGIGTLETWVSPRGKHRGLFSSLRDRMARRTYSYEQLHSDARILREFLKRRGPFDVLWANSESPDGLVAAVAAKRGVKFPPILLQVQALRCRFEKGVPLFTEKPPLTLAFRQATRILANSEMIVGFLGQYAGRGLAAEALQAKVHVVFPNIQRIFFRAAQESPQLPAPMRDRVLFLGALNQRKGAPVFLRAIPKTEASKRNATFVMIGDFTENNQRFVQRWEEARETARAQLPAARIEYLGRVSSLEVIRQVRLAQVVVIPSLFDAFSRGVIESLLLHHPVITTSQEGASYLVESHQCGIIIAPNDTNVLAHAIDAILSPIVPFAQKARHVQPKLFQGFSTETIAAEVARHLSEIAK